jgi:hypothetical protein
MMLTPLNLSLILSPKMIQEQIAEEKMMRTERKGRRRRQRERGKQQAPQLREGEAPSITYKMLSPLVICVCWGVANYEGNFFD